MYSNWKYLVKIQSVLSRDICKSKGQDDRKASADYQSDLARSYFKTDFVIFTLSPHLYFSLGLFFWPQGYAHHSSHKPYAILVATREQTHLDLRCFRSKYNQATLMCFSATACFSLSSGESSTWGYRPARRDFTSRGWEALQPAVAVWCQDSMAKGAPGRQRRSRRLLSLSWNRDFWSWIHSRSWGQCGSEAWLQRPGAPLHSSGSFPQHHGCTECFLQTEQQWGQPLQTESRQKELRPACAGESQFSVRGKERERKDRDKETRWKRKEDWGGLL